MTEGLSSAGLVRNFGFGVGLCKVKLTAAMGPARRPVSGSKHWHCLTRFIHAAFVPFAIPQCTKGAINYPSGHLYCLGVPYYNYRWAPKPYPND